MVHLKALGKSAIEVGDTRIGPEQPYLFAIALYLIVERGKRIPRQALVDLIWPNVRDEKHARQRFRQALLRLREFGMPIAGENGTLLVEKTAASTDFDTLASPDSLSIGQSLEFLPHYVPRISDRFLDWVETHRSRVHATVQRHFLARMQQARTRGDWAEIDELATECLRLDPYNEEAVMAHAECAAMRGSKREALSILDSYMEALGTQVGTIGLPAKILRTRIAERLTDHRYAMISEQHFVGREASMELLLGLLREAKRGAGSAALVWGEPGIGKSRLVQELTQVAALDGAQVVSTKCHPTDAGRPLSAFADFVPMLKMLPGALGCSAQTLSLLQRLTERNKSEAFLQQEAGDAAFLAATIRRAVFDLVDAVADEGMLVMVIEDVHWLDEPSWAILSAMVEWSTTRTLLILMTSRTPHATEAKVADPDRGFHRHHLLPLADADSVTLLDRLAADDANPLPDSVREWSVAAAEGNPFYLRELVRNWVETQQVYGVPRSLAELIEARLNRLSSLALRVLQLCSAFGKHSSFERLEKAAGYQNHVLLDAIEELSSAAMLAPDKPGVAVKHDLLATAALARLGGAALKLVHRQVATVLEAEISQNWTASVMWDCAEHWNCADDTARALSTVRLCAKYLHAVAQPHQAVELYQKALLICATPDEKIETLLGLAASLRTADEWTQLQRLLEDVASIAPEVSSDFAADQFLLWRLEADWRLDNRYALHASELLSFAQDEDKLPAQRLQAVQLAIMLCGENAEKERARALIGVLDRLESTPEQAAIIAHTRMIFEADFGDLSKALGHAHALLALDRPMCEAASIIRERNNIASCFRRAGRINEAAELIKKTFDFAVEHHLEALAVRAAIYLTFLYLQNEDTVMAGTWRAKARPYEHSMDQKAYVESLAYIDARIGLSVGDLTFASRFLEGRLVRNSGKSMLLRQCYTAIEFEMQLASGHSLSRRVVEKAARNFEEIAGIGPNDYFALMLYRAMLAIGERTRAHGMLMRFVTDQRRERGPLMPSLAAEIKRLGLSAKPRAI